MNEHTDTRVTDYALGELPEAERLQLEAQLKDDAELRGTVEETRRLAGLLQAANPSAAENALAVVEPFADLRDLVQSRLVAAPTVLPMSPTPGSSERCKWNIVVAGLSAAFAASLALIFTEFEVWKSAMRQTGEISHAPWMTDRSASGTADMGRFRQYQLNDSDINPGSTGAPGASTPLVLKGNNTYTGGTSLEGTLREKFDSKSVPAALSSTAPVSTTAPVAGPVIHSPTPARPGEQSVTRRTGSSFAISGGLGGGAGGGGLGITTQPLNSPVPHYNRFNYTAGGSTDSRGGDQSGRGRIDPQAQQPNQPPVSGKPASNEMYPLLLAHQEQLAKYGPKHPKVLETELRIKALSEHVESLSAASVEEFSKKTGASNEVFPLHIAHQEALAKYGPKHPKVLELELKLKAVSEHVATETEQSQPLPRLVVRNQSDVAATDPMKDRWNVDVNGDGKADTLWIDLGRPAKPAELADLQILTDELASNVRSETWREAKSAEELERRLSEDQGYFDFQARVDSIRRNDQAMNTSEYDSVPENPFYRTTDAPLSTFSIDVDTASYSNVRRYLTSGQLPPPAAVRLEEFVNYFTYDYPQPTGDEPFSVTTEAARCPWNGDHVLVRVGLKGREVHRKERPASNLVFLVDVSGSMQEPNKLPLVRESLKLLTRELGDSDRVAIVVYAGSTGLVLPPTGGDRKQTILEAIDRLEAGGSTNGGAGIELAYQLATDNFIPKGINRVILATDGDFNVGITDQGSLVRLIEEKAKSKVFFSALGYGMGNLKDSTLEKLSDKGNGNYAYIDTLKEAKKVLVEQMSGTLMTIAKDVKIQIEFNPTTVAGYRLLGYENRVLAAQDFNDDKKDAGEIGAGHTVTALYELIPAGKPGKKETKKLPTVDALKYQTPAEPAPQAKELADELLTLKLRYKQPEGDVSKLLEKPLKHDVTSYAKASPDFKFASSVAGFGMLLRHSKYHGSATFDAVLELAQEGVGRDEGGYRKEFVELVRKAMELSNK